MKKSFYLVCLVSSLGFASNSYQPVSPIFSTILSSAPAVANASATVTVPATTGFGSYSTGYNNYLTSVHIEDRNTGGVAGANNTVVNCTLSGAGATTMTFGFLGAATTGQINTVNENFSYPVVISTAAATLLCPATANTLWNVHIGYITFP